MWDAASSLGMGAIVHPCALPTLGGQAPREVAGAEETTGAALTSWARTSLAQTGLVPPVWQALASGITVRGVPASPRSSQREQRRPEHGPSEAAPG